MKSFVSRLSHHVLTGSKFHIDFDWVDRIRVFVILKTASSDSASNTTHYSDNYQACENCRHNQISRAFLRLYKPLIVVQLIPWVGFSRVGPVLERIERVESVSLWDHCDQVTYALVDHKLLATLHWLLIVDWECAINH